MLRFRTQAHARVASLVGLTDEALLYCAQARSVEEGQQRLEDLRANVKKAYKRCALALHPDRTGGCKQKEEEFKELARIFPEVERLLAGLRVGARQRPRIRVQMAQPTVQTTTSSVPSSYDIWRTWTSTSSA